MKKTTPKLWLREGAIRSHYKNIKAGISVCTPALLQTKIIGDKPTIPAKAKLRFSTKPAKGYRRVWFHATGMILWYGLHANLANGLVPGGLADWMDRNNLLPIVRGLHTPVFLLYIKLVKAK